MFHHPELKFPHIPYHRILHSLPSLLRSVYGIHLRFALTGLHMFQPMQPSRLPSSCYQAYRLCIRSHGMWSKDVRWSDHIQLYVFPLQANLAFLPVYSMFFLHHQNRTSRISLVFYHFLPAPWSVFHPVSGTFRLHRFHICFRYFYNQLNIFPARSTVHFRLHQMSDSSWSWHNHNHGKHPSISECNFPVHLLTAQDLPLLRLYVFSLLRQKKASDSYILSKFLRHHQSRQYPIRLFVNPSSDMLKSA